MAAGDALTYGSLFTGIGGIDLGLERAGWTPRWQVEIDPLRREVLQRHWPNVRRFGDIGAVRSSELERVDLIAGGFPCEDISHAGRGTGIEGEQSGLWAEFARVVRDLRPGYVLVENVTALLARGFGRVVGDLAAIGYDAEWDCIPAAAVGAPQLRARAFILAYPRGDGGQARIEPICAGRMQSELRARWQPEPNLDRVANGLPGGLDRVQWLGDACVPQIPEIIGRAILTAHNRGA
jgi:DNA (cytosine-5)-methyltransferase 1